MSTISTEGVGAYRLEPIGTKRTITTLVLIDDTPVVLKRVAPTDEPHDADSAGDSLGNDGVGAGDAAGDGGTGDGDGLMWERSWLVAARRLPAVRPVGHRAAAALRSDGGPGPLLTRFETPWSLTALAPAPPTAAELMAELCLTVAEFHRHDLVHGNLDADHVLCRPRRRRGWDLIVCSPAPATDRGADRVGLATVAAQLEILWSLDTAPEPSDGSDRHRWGRIGRRHDRAAEADRVGAWSALVDQMAADPTLSPQRAARLWSDLAGRLRDRP